MDRIAEVRPTHVHDADDRAQLRDWLRDGVAVWRAHPFGVLGLALAPIVFEGLCQLVPGAGIVVSKLLTPLVGAWALAALDTRSRRGSYSPSVALRQVMDRARPLLGIAGIALGLFALQCAVAALLGGPSQAAALAGGDVTAITLGRIDFALVLASAVLPATALMFVSPRVVLDGMDLRAALADNSRLVRRHASAVLVLGLLTALLVGSVVFAPWLLLLLLPLHLCIGYAAYRDVDRRDAR